ncbi:NTF2-like protein [Serendipita vermifera]|nr:NTF2-like protein [Serendipita vermifera]
MFSFWETEAEKVAWIFVSDYFSKLSKDKSHLRGYFREESVLSWNDENLRGVDAIMNKIQGFNAGKVFLYGCKGQALGNGALFLVGGTFSPTKNAEGKDAEKEEKGTTLDFCQTFFTTEENGRFFIEKSILCMAERFEL